MTAKLGRMTKEEKALSYEVQAREEFDPKFRDRIQLHLMIARGQLKDALANIAVSPETIDELDYKVRTYGKLLAVALKMNVVEKTKDDAFAEANVTAQSEEADKLCESSDNV